MVVVTSKGDNSVADVWRLRHAKEGRSLVSSVLRVPTSHRSPLSKAR